MANEIPKGLFKILHYAADTGIFTWTVNTGGHGCVKSGTRAGGIKQGGYRFIKHNRIFYREHRDAHAAYMNAARARFGEFARSA